MEKITDNKLWNVYYEHCGTTSKEYFVTQDDDMEKNMNFVNDEAMALQVCAALNKYGVCNEDNTSESGSFTADDVERAYDDGYQTEGEVSFDIENYR